MVNQYFFMSLNNFNNFDPNNEYELIKLQSYEFLNKLYYLSFKELYPNKKKFLNLFYPFSLQFYCFYKFNLNDKIQDTKNSKNKTIYNFENYFLFFNFYSKKKNIVNLKNIIDDIIDEKINIKKLKFISNINKNNLLIRFFDFFYKFFIKFIMFFKKNFYLYDPNFISRSEKINFLIKNNFNFISLPHFFSNINDYTLKKKLLCELVKNKKISNIEKKYFISFVISAPNKLFHLDNMMFNDYGDLLNKSLGIVSVFSHFYDINFKNFIFHFQKKYKKNLLVHPHGNGWTFKKYHTYHDVNKYLTNFYVRKWWGFNPLSHYSKKSSIIFNAKILYVCANLPNNIIETLDWSSLQLSFFINLRLNLHLNIPNEFFDLIIIREHPRQNHLYGNFRSKFISLKFKRSKNIKLLEDLKSCNFTILEDLFTSAIYDIISLNKLIIFYTPLKYKQFLTDKGLSFYEELKNHGFLANDNHALVPLINKYYNKNLDKYLLKQKYIFKKYLIEFNEINKIKDVKKTLYDISLD